MLSEKADGKMAKAGLMPKTPYEPTTTRTGEIVMSSSRELRTIVRNLIALYINKAFEDMLLYQKALNHGLCKSDLEAVKQAFRAHLNGRI